MDQVEIANAALLELGSQTISAFDEGTPEANMVSMLWESVVEEVLTEGVWTCMRRRLPVVQVNEKPLFGFSNTYLIPKAQDIVQILSIYGKDDILIPVPARPPYESTQNSWQVEGEHLLSNQQVKGILVSVKDLDTKNWDIYFRQTVLALLKVRIATNKSAERGVVDGFRQEYAKCLRNNKSRNNMQQSPKRTTVRTYIRGT